MSSTKTADPTIEQRLDALERRLIGALEANDRLQAEAERTNTRFNKLWDALDGPIELASTVKADLAALRAELQARLATIEAVQPIRDALARLARAADEERAQSYQESERRKAEDRERRLRAVGTVLLTEGALVDRHKGRHIEVTAEGVLIVLGRSVGAGFVEPPLTIEPANDDERLANRIAYHRRRIALQVKAADAWRLSLTGFDQQPPRWDAALLGEMPSTEGMSTEDQVGALVTRIGQAIATERRALAELTCAMAKLKAPEQVITAEELQRRQVVSEAIERNRLAKLEQQERARMVAEKLPEVLAEPVEAE